MEHTTLTPISQENEVSLKNLIIKMQDWGKYLLFKWKLILLFGILGAGIGLAYAWFKKPKFVAELTFVMEDSKSNPLAGYSGIASQFGIDIGGGSGGGVFTGDNILEFLRSRLMVEKTLLSPLNVNGKKISLADFYLDITEIRKNWASTSPIKNLSFPPDADHRNFSRQQDSVLNTIWLSIIKENLQVIKPDKKLSFIAVRCISPDEIFSKVFTERLVKEATDFYVQTKTKRSKINVDKLQEKADSIEELLNRKTYSVAASQDLNRNPGRSVASVNTELASRDKAVLQTMYIEVMKNLEVSRMSMAQEMPIIQVVDSPILPLRKEKLGKLKSLIIGGFISGFLIVLFLMVRKLYKEIMA
ncbi:lipopolysaccharide biosynthesis protein [Chitinophaga sp. SYP-B3965]|uniref:lipopolysaccharide biosynthesis protein n=1 Tax=Chitinophaga sp. SYP-B3965 TaxID=2663120 RepID=UPI001299B0BC|nr:lipopolysaccharide biosynthesis protein [Chitinophaga sp. SYP-B3965]MRG46931.1 lipopolysaccharide biosynthesis protein [Chitinophaga sp. SYP-B3965]